MFRKPSAVFGQLLKNHEDFENQNSEVQTLISALLNRYIYSPSQKSIVMPPLLQELEIIPAVREAAFRPGGDYRVAFKRRSALGLLLFDRSDHISAGGNLHYGVHTFRRRVTHRSASRSDAGAGAGAADGAQAFRTGARR